jgi:hypothetical protein
MMVHRPALAALALLAVTVGAMGCSGPPAAASGGPTTAAATTAPTAGATTTGAPSPDVGSVPPVADLAVEGGDPVAGQLGSFVWGDGGSDSPWLPGAPLPAGAGEPLTVTVAGELGIGRWTARLVAAGVADGTGATALGSGTGGPVTFTAPGPGAWSVQVTIDYAGDVGSATYYWRLDVP